MEGVSFQMRLSLPIFLFKQEVNPGPPTGSSTVSSSQPTTSKFQIKFPLTSLDRCSHSPSGHTGMSKLLMFITRVKVIGKEKIYRWVSI
jgi:hypothetical protein